MAHSLLPLTYPYLGYYSPELDERTGSLSGYRSIFVHFLRQRPLEHNTEIPRGVAVDRNNRKLWVADAGNHRLLRYSLDSLSASNSAAELVLGHPASPLLSPTILWPAK